MAGTAVGFISDHQVDVEFLACLLHLLKAEQDEIQNRVIQSRGYAGRLDIGRSTVAKVFLDQTDADYLLTLDDDMVFTPENFRELLHGLERSPELTVISGLYMQTDGQPCVFREAEDGTLQNVHPTNLMHRRYYEAASVGAGFSLIPRKVFEALAEAAPDHPLPWYDNTARGNAGQPLADDSSFYHKVRQAGGKVYVDTKVPIGHLKKVTMMPKMEPQLQIAREVPK